MQTQLNFTSPSPINIEKLTGQNKEVYDLLKTGKTINRIEAIGKGITALNSRISDLRNRVGITIFDRFITTSGGSKVKEYSMFQFLSNG